MLSAGSMCWGGCDEKVPRSTNSPPASPSPPPPSSAAVSPSSSSPPPQAAATRTSAMSTAISLAMVLRSRTDELSLGGDAPGVLLQPQGQDDRGEGEDHGDGDGDAVEVPLHDRGTRCGAPDAPAEHVREAPALPAVQEHEQDEQQRHGHVDDDDGGGQHGRGFVRLIRRLMTLPDVAVAHV